MHKTQTKVIIIASLVILIGAIMALVVGVILTRQSPVQIPVIPNNPENPAPMGEEIDMTETPKFKTEEIKTKLDNPWDIGFLPDNEIVYTQRNGNITVSTSQKDYSINGLNNFFSQGEGGLLSLAVDPEFSMNRYLYVCYNTQFQSTYEVKVVRLELTNDYKIESQKDLVTKLPATNSGRHSGCQLEFGPDDYLWIGTGDAAMGTNPQDPKSLGGKVLRVDREGKVPPDNLGGDFDPRIFSYGHRNVQGITFIKTTSSSTPVGISSEHGPGVDDEINILSKGNYGWDPIPGYNESVPMTDKSKYPDAIESIWSSGDPTIALSGITQINGQEWRLWDGAIASAALAGKRVNILKFTESGKLEVIDTILTNIGRVRTIQQSPDGSLYVLTDNGNDTDKIIKLSVN